MNVEIGHAFLPQEHLVRYLFIYLFICYFNDYVTTSVLISPNDRAFVSNVKIGGRGLI